MSSLRVEKVGELLREELGKLLVSELRLKAGVLATISRVRVSPNLREARVSVSVFPEAEADYVHKTIDNELYRLQGILNRRLHMRPLPRLFFEHDVMEHNAQAVEETLRLIEKETEL